MLNFVSAPRILRQVFVKSLEEKCLTQELVSIDLVDDQKESVLIPENTRTLRNGKKFLTKSEIVTKFYFKKFEHFSKFFLNCFELDIFEEKFCNFNIWLNSNITNVVSPLQKTSPILI